MSTATLRRIQSLKDEKGFPVQPRSKAAILFYMFSVQQDVLSDYRIFDVSVIDAHVSLSEALLKFHSVKIFPDDVDSYYMDVKWYVQWKNCAWDQYTLANIMFKQVRDLETLDEITKYFEPTRCVSSDRPCSWLAVWVRWWLLKATQDDKQSSQGTLNSVDVKVLEIKACWVGASRSNNGLYSLIQDITEEDEKVQAAWWQEIGGCVKDTSAELITWLEDSRMGWMRPTNSALKWDNLVGAELGHSSVRIWSMRFEFSNNCI